MMILDWLCERSEISRPQNWFSPIELKKEDLVREIETRYCGRFNYEFSIDVQELITKILTLKPAREILSNNMKHNMQQTAYVMKSWDGEMPFYLNVLKCRIASLGKKDIKGIKNFIDTLLDPLFEEALLADAEDQDYKRAKEIMTEAVDALLANKEIAGSTEKYLKKAVKNNQLALFSQVVQSIYGYKLFNMTETITWGAYFNRPFVLKDGTRVKIKVLDFKTVQKYADELIALQNSNHPDAKLTKDELLGNYIYEAKEQKQAPAKWEHSLIAFSEKEKVIGFALNYEKSEEGYPECIGVQGSLCLHIVDVDFNYQDKGLDTFLILNSISKFAATGFKVLKTQKSMFVTIQTRWDDQHMITVLENKIGFELAGKKVYSGRKVNRVYALDPVKKKNPASKKGRDMPIIAKRHLLTKSVLSDAI